MTILEYDISPLVLFCILVAAAAGLVMEALYLLFYSSATYRKRINRRLQLLGDSGNRANVLVQLRRERGLTNDGDFQLGIASFNQLLLQSGLNVGVGKLAAFSGFAGLVAFAATSTLRGGMIESSLVALAGGVLLPYLVLRVMRARRMKRFAVQFPDAIDVIVRSLRAGHPVPVAIAMVSREFADPIGSEFGIVADEITYGADVETAIRNLYFRVGQDDLPLFVTAVSIQGSTGGNLSEILENLSGVIRQRFKLRRKVKAMASEARFSAMILSALPIGMFFVVQFVSPDFYGTVWKYDLTHYILYAAATWMVLGNLIMYRMVNFKI
jgi:tight adherence protein B